MTKKYQKRNYKSCHGVFSHLNFWEHIIMACLCTLLHMTELLCKLASAPQRELEWSAHKTKTWKMCLLN